MLFLLVDYCQGLAGVSKAQYLADPNSQTVFFVTAAMSMSSASVLVRPSEMTLVSIVDAEAGMSRHLLSVGVELSYTVTVVVVGDRSEGQNAYDSMSATITTRYIIFIKCFDYICAL